MKLVEVDYKTILRTPRGNNLMDFLEARLQTIGKSHEQLQVFKIYIYNFQSFCSGLYDVTQYIFLIIFIGMA